LKNKNILNKIKYSQRLSWFGYIIYTIPFESVRGILLVKYFGGMNPVSPKYFIDTFPDGLIVNQVMDA